MTLPDFSASIDPHKLGYLPFGTGAFVCRDHRVTALLSEEADYVFTGEGRMDGQSLSGKTPVGIAMRAKRFGVPVIGIVGSLGKDLEPLYQTGFTAILSTIRDLASLEDTLHNAKADLIATAQSVVRLIAARP